MAAATCFRFKHKAQTRPAERVWYCYIVYVVMLWWNKQLWRLGTVGSYLGCMCHPANRDHRVASVLCSLWSTCHVSTVNIEVLNWFKPFTWSCTLPLCTRFEATITGTQMFVGLKIDWNREWVKLLNQKHGYSSVESFHSKPTMSQHQFTQLISKP